MTERTTANAGIAAQSVGFFLAWRSAFNGSRLAGRFILPSLPRTALAVLLLACAAGLFIASRRTLGPQWSIQARTLADHRLIASGPYSVVRHPIYLALGFFLVAVCVVAAPWWTFAAALGCYGLGATLRIRAEERLLSARFGSQFDEYRRRVPALVPRCR